MTEPWSSECGGGDCAWDVGANRGIYLSKLLAAVGEHGVVVAFEPLPENASVLRNAFADRANVQLHQLALGASDTQGVVLAGNDGLRATTKVVPASGADGSAERTSIAGIGVVQVRAADTLVTEVLVPQPDVIKLDVEGAELDCLQGMHAILGGGRLRAIGIEIHYGLLAAREQAGAPRDIELLLSSFGYRVTWTDRSHLIADLPERRT